MSDDSSFQQAMRRIEALLQEVECFKDPEEREKVRELVRSLMDVHGAALAKMLAIAAQAGEPGRALIDAYAGDRAAASLLLLYGLHPVDLETRVRTALERVRPSLHSHGGDVELLGVVDGVVRLHLARSANGRHWSAAALAHAVEEALQEAAPDLAAIQTEGMEEPPAHVKPTFIPVEQLLGGKGDPAPRP